MGSSTSNSERFTVKPLLPFLKALAAWAVGLFVAGELLLRVAGLGYPDLGYPDLDRGWRLRENAEGWVAGENKAGVYVKINSDGMRDREHTVDKKPGVFRVALLGNSYAEAFIVPLEQSFWAVAEKRMAACLPPGYEQIEFLNFGVGGYGTAQQFLTLEKHAWKYQPDAVLVAMVTNHDVWYNDRKLAQVPQSPYYFYDDGKLVLDDSFRALIRNPRLKRIQTVILDQLRTLQLVKHWREASRQKVFEVMLNLRGTAQAGSSGKVTLREVDQVYAPPAPDAEWENAWKVTEGILTMMRDQARSHGAPLWVASLSNSQQVDPDPAVRQALAQALGTNDLFYPERRLQEIAGRMSVPLVLLAPELARLAEERKIELHGFPGSPGGHWNETGNRMAGELLAQGLCPLLQPGAGK